MAKISSNTPVLDFDGFPAAGRIVRAYRRDTGVLLSSGSTSDGTDQIETLQWSPSANNPGWDGYTLRVVSPAVAAVGDSVRVSFSAGTSVGANIMQIGSAYVGLKASTGDSYDFAATPVQLLFSGSPSVSASGGEIIESDVATIDIPAGASLVVSAYFSGSTELRSASPVPSGWAGYFKAGDSASVVNEGAYTLGPSIYAVTNIDVIDTALPVGMYELSDGGFSGEVNVVCLDDSGGTVYNDLILRTTPV